MNSERERKEDCTANGAMFQRSRALLVWEKPVKCLPKQYMIKDRQLLEMLQFILKIT